jgi:hypothetical protein
MNRRLADNLSALACLLFLTPFGIAWSSLTAGAQEEPPVVALTAQQQSQLLASRDTLPQLLSGDVDRFVNLYFTLRQIAFHTDVMPEQGLTLAPVFPKFYKPTHRELFQAFGRQTKADAFQYDAARDYWVFSHAKDALPYEIALAEGWKAEDHGRYMKYFPPSARVGMDVYFLGQYSADTKEEADKLFAKVRDHHALAFAPIPDLKLEQMARVKVAGSEALHLEAYIAKSDRVWRQWVFVAEGHAYGIASAFAKDQDEQLAPALRAMVESFKPRAAPARR